jgi:hypothetical protein
MDCDTVPEYVGIVTAIPPHRIRIEDMLLSCRRVRVGVRWELLSTTSCAPCRQILSCTTSYGLSWGFPIISSCVSVLLYLYCRFCSKPFLFRLNFTNSQSRCLHTPVNCHHMSTTYELHSLTHTNERTPPD